MIAGFDCSSKAIHLSLIDEDENLVGLEKFESKDKDYGYKIFTSELDINLLFDIQNILSNGGFAPKAYEIFLHNYLLTSRAFKTYHLSDYKITDSKAK